LDREWWEAALVMAVVVIGMLLGSLTFFDAIVGAQVSVSSVSLGLKYFVPLYSQTDGTYIYLFGYNNSAGVAALAIYDPVTQSVVDYIEYSSWSQFTGGYASPNAPYIYAFAGSTIVAINKTDFSVVNSYSAGRTITGAIYYEGALYFSHSYVGNSIYTNGYVGKCNANLSSCTLEYAQTTNSVPNTVAENFINEFAVYEVGGILLTAVTDVDDNVLVYAYETPTETIADVGSTVTGKWLGADYDSDNGRFLGYFFSNGDVVVRFYTYSAGSLSLVATVTCSPSMGVESFGFVKYLGNGTLAVGYLNSSTTYVDYFSIDTSSCTLFKTETVEDSRPYYAAEVINGTLYYFVYSPTTYETGVVAKEAVSTVTTTVEKTVTTTATVTVPVTKTVNRTVTVTTTSEVVITKGYTTTIRDTVTAWKTLTGLLPTVYTVTEFKPMTVTETTTVTKTKTVTETVTETSPSTTTYVTTYTTQEPVVTTTEYVTTVTTTYVTTTYYTTVVTEPWWIVTRIYPTTITGTTTYVTTVTETTTIKPVGVIVPVEIPAVMGVTTVYEPVPVPVEETVTTTVYVPKVESGGYMVYLFALLFVVLLIVGLRLARRR